MAHQTPQSVLFACHHNAIRSPMAQGLVRFFYGRRFYVASCGVHPQPLDPFAIVVMEEMGVSIAHHRPKSFDDVDAGSFDLIVSLAPQAHHCAMELTRTFAVCVDYWPTHDPSFHPGSREQILSGYRLVRDQLAQTIHNRFGNFVDSSCL